MLGSSSNRIGDSDKALYSRAENKQSGYPRVQEMNGAQNKGFSRVAENEESIKCFSG